MADSQQDEIAKLEALYASNPGGRVFTHLAEAYRKAGNLERAREIASDGLQRHDGYASAHVVMGRIFLDMGRRDDAAAEFRRVLQLDPENRIALRGLGDYERDRGMTDEALRHYRQLEHFDPGDDELTATIRALDEQRSGGGAVAAAEPSGGPEPDYFGSFSAESFQSQPHDEPAAPLPEPGETTPEQPAFGADPAASDFEPLPLALDWTKPGAAGGTGPEAPDLRLDWNLDAAGDFAAASPLDAGGIADAAAREGIGDDFRLDLPGSGVPTGSDEAGATRHDPAAAWRELEEAASAALPPADYDALPAAGESTGAAHDEVAAAGGSAADEPQHAAGQQEGPSNADWSASVTDDAGGELDDVAYQWQEPDEASEVPDWSPSPDVVDQDLPLAAETEVYTETLAELYRAQGFRERAIDVYRALLADRPGDQRLLMKLRELEGVDLEEAPVSPHAASWQALADSLEQGSRHGEDASGVVAMGAADHDAAFSGSRAEPAAAETERPEPDWMEGVESAWTGGEGAVAAAEGLYAPPSEADESGDGLQSVPLARLLGTLLDWQPTRRPEEDPAEELLLLDEVAEDAASVDVVGQADGPTGPGDGGESDRQPADDEAADPWMGASPDEADADDATGPRTFQAARAWEERMPWEQRSPEPARDATPGEESAGLMPWESAASSQAEGGAGGTAPGPGGVGNPFETTARGESGASSQQSGEGDSEDDDDDLEMFRSWLQSLRR